MFRAIPVGLRSARLRGVVFYLGALATFASMDATTKFLLTRLPLVQVMWGRFLFHFCVVAIGLRLVGIRPRLLPNAPGSQIVRSLALAATSLCFSAALQRIPLAETSALNFLSPGITVALAAVWLHESVGWRRWAGLGIGLCGMVLLVRPGAGAVNSGVLFGIGSAVGNAVYQILTRRLVGIDRPSTTIVQTGLWATLLMSGVLPFVWVWPSAGAWALLVMIGTLGGAGHFLLILAFERSPASLLAPLTYLQLLLALLFGALIYGEFPDALGLLGAAVIAAGGLIVIQRDDPPTATCPASPCPAAPRPTAAWATQGMRKGGGK